MKTLYLLGLLSSVALGQGVLPGGGGGVVVGGSTGFTTILNVTASPYNADRTDTTITTAAIQAAIDTCDRTGLSAGCGVYMPAGTYKTAQPLRIRSSNTRLFGDGYGTHLHVIAAVPAILIGPDFAGIPTATSITPGGTVPAWDFSATSPGYLIELSQAPYLNGTSHLDGLHSLQVIGRYKPKDNGGPYYLMQSEGSRTISEAQDKAFYVENGSGTMFAHVTLSGSGAVTCQKSGVFTSAAVVEWEMNWDDTTNELRGYKDGVKIVWDSCTGGVGPTGLSGTLVQRLWEDVSIGPTFNGWRFQQTVASGPAGILSGDTQLRYNNGGSNAFFHTGASYSTSAQVPFDAGTLWCLTPSWQVTWSGGPASNYYEPNNHQSGTVVFRNDDGSTVTDVEVDHLRITGSMTAGVFGFSAIRVNVHNVIMSGVQRDGIRLRGNCYGSTIRNVLADSGGGAAALVSIEQTGLVDISDVYLYGANCPIIVAAGSMTGNNLYLTPSTTPQGVCDVYCSGAGFGNSQCTISGGALGNEVGYFYRGAPVILDSLVTAVISGATLQSQYDTFPPDAFVLANRGLSTHGFPITLTGIQWQSGSAGANPTVKVSLLNWDRKSVRVIGDYDNGTSAITYTDHPEWVVTDPQQGTCTVTGAATTCTWTYPHAEMDTANMSVPCNVSAISASAASNSWRIKSCTKTTTAATATLEAAPGGPETITVDFSTRR